ncbi:MAG: hypothetical protein U0270_03575 [Labilithrix sp.]
MNRRTLARLLGGWAIFLVLLLLGMRTYVAHGTPKEPWSVRTYWRLGKRVERVIAHEKATTVAHPDHLPFADFAEEIVTGESPLFATSLLLDVGLVPGLDGVRAELDGKTVFATVDDLMSAQAYDRGHLWVEASFGWGVYREIVFAVLAEQLGVSARDVETRAKLTRVRMQRGQVEKKPIAGGPVAPKPDHIEEKDLTHDLVLDSLREAAMHLARAVDMGGRFRYLINAPDNRDIPGYNWPRHSGATFFLAQAAGILDDSYLRYSALRAAGRLRTEMMRPCGTHRCITEDQPVADLGSSALALIAFTEIARTGADASFKPTIKELAEFLRSQQRPDGEFMHFYNRMDSQPIDRQSLYYSGEATLGLARAHEVNGDPKDLEAAKAALSRISGAGWSFFGSRYYFSEEHWTCQAVAELWSRAPDRDALAFCSRWHEFQRRLQYSPSDSPFDADGAFGFGPLVSPRVTPASSRGEAAGALLMVLLHEPEKHPDEIPLVQTELNRALAFVLRNQFHPGPTYLFAEPVTIRGALPGSPVDWQLRIDYAQHAGCMMARWLEIEAQKKGAAPSVHSAR